MDDEMGDNIQLTQHMTQQQMTQQQMTQETVAAVPMVGSAPQHPPPQQHQQYHANRAAAAAAAVAAGGASAEPAGGDASQEVNLPARPAGPAKVGAQGGLWIEGQLMANYHRLACWVHSGRTQ